MKQVAYRDCIPQTNLLKRFISLWIALILSCWAIPCVAQQATVDITPGHATNSFSPLRSLGAGIDRDPLDSVKILYGSTDVQQMLRLAGEESATA
jgi:hypothetical protein